MKRLILRIISPYLVDKFNATVPYTTVQYGTGLTIFTCGSSHLAMRFVLAAGPSRTIPYVSTVRYRQVLLSDIVSLSNNNCQNV